MAGSEVPPIEEVVRKLQTDVLDIERTLARVETRLGEMGGQLGGLQSLSGKVDGLNTRAEKLLSDLRTLSSMTARSSSGQSLINLVSLIHDKVRTL